MLRVTNPSLSLRCCNIVRRPVFLLENKSRILSTSNCFQTDKNESKLELVSDNLVTRLYKKMFTGIPKTKLKASGYILCTVCTQKVDIPTFFSKFDMPDTFYSWFLVTELHVWLIGARLMSEGDAGRAVRNALVEALWIDCDNRAKAIGDMASSVRSKNIVAIAEEFQAALFIYDEGILGNDIQLSNALWRRFFVSMREARDDELSVPDPEQLLLLVKYVRLVASYLDKMDATEIIVKNNISWPRLDED